jgi:metal-responsive CopG/Arc/MetJ family transcriptional regulator
MKAKIAIAIEPELLARIDKTAAKFELSRSQFIENLLSTGLDDAEALNALGITDVIKTLSKFKDKLKVSVGLKKSLGKKYFEEPSLRKL